MNRRSIILTVAIACLIGGLSPVVAAAPTVPATSGSTQPARAADDSSEPVAHKQSPPPIRSSLDSELIHRGGDGGSPASPTALRPPSMELPRVAGALAIVIAFIFLLRWAGKKFFVSGNLGKSTRAVQVLARSSISPRQHILLLRVGRRVIVVGDTGAQMNSLSEITDADEIAALLGQLQDEKTRLPVKAFSALFNRARDEMSGEEADLDSGARTDAEDADHSPEDGHHDPAISETREEISGLMDKIRLLSKHFPGGQA